MISDDASTRFVMAMATGIVDPSAIEQASEECAEALGEVLGAHRKSLVLEVQFTGFSSQGSRVGPVDPVIMQAAARLIVLRVNRIGFTTDADADMVRAFLIAVAGNTPGAPQGSVVDRLAATAPAGIYLGLGSGEVYRPASVSRQTKESAEQGSEGSTRPLATEAHEPEEEGDEAVSFEALELVDDPMPPPPEPPPPPASAETSAATDAHRPAGGDSGRQGAGGAGLFDFFRSTDPGDARASEDDLAEQLRATRDLAEYDALCQAAEAAIGEWSRQRQSERVLPVVVALAEEASRGDRSRVFRETAEKALQRAADRTILGSLIEIAEVAERDHRRRVLSAFIVVGARGTDFLQRALLRSHDPDTRADIFHALRLSGLSVIQLLDRTLEQSGPPAIHRVATIAHEHQTEDGAEALAWLQNLSEHDDRRVRTQVAHAIADFDDPVRIRVLLRLLDDPATEVRIAAIEALGEAGDPAATSFLLRAVDTDDEEIAIAAIEALGVLRAGDAVPQLTALIRQRGWLGKEKHVARKQAALRALGSIGTAAALEGVRVATRSKEARLASEASEVLRRAEAG